MAPGIDAAPKKAPVGQKNAAVTAPWVPANADDVDGQNVCLKLCWYLKLLNKVCRVICSPAREGVVASVRKNRASDPICAEINIRLQGVKMSGLHSS
jgi:hypothetical protein